MNLALTRSQRDMFREDDLWSDLKIEVPHLHVSLLNVSSVRNMTIDSREARENISRTKWNLFICHASEDKNEIARPLAEALTKKGLRVWYDEFTLKLGDSLLRKIDDGLSNSRYGVVILSHSFFRKNWTKKELGGLVAREDGKHTVIFPIWHKLTRNDVTKYSPILADKMAVSTEKGLDFVVRTILEAISSNETRETSLESDHTLPKRVRVTENDLVADVKSVIPRVANGKSHVERGGEASETRILWYLKSKVDSCLRLLKDSQRRFEKLILDETALDSIAVHFPALVSLMTDFRGMAGEINDLVDSYVRIAESKIDYLQTPDSSITRALTVARLMGEDGKEREQFEQSRKWKQWAMDQAALIGSKRRKLLELVEELKVSLDKALEHENIHSA